MPGVDDYSLYFSRSNYHDFWPGSTTPAVGTANGPLFSIKVFMKIKQCMIVHTIVLAHSFSIASGAKRSIVRTALCLFFCGIGMFGYGQAPHQDRNSTPVNINLPKAPEVATFEKFIQNPVSLHTGLHAVSIPIHVISLRGAEIPISLNYHSSGIKVDEIASEVGLGWGLEAGGVVSTNVHGIPDQAGHWPPPGEYPEKIKDISQFLAFYPGGLITAIQAEALEDPLDQFSNGDTEFLKGVIRGEKDSEPDFYNFSGPGLSGQFFLDESEQWRSVPFQKIKIESSGAGFRITDERGTIYTYHGITISGTTTWPYNTGGQANVYPPNTNYNTYYLTSVTTQLGDVATYYYSDYGYADNRTVVTRSTRAAFSNVSCALFLPHERVDSLASNTGVGAKRLDSLVTSTGERVIFEYSNQGRQDIAANVKTQLQYITMYKKLNGIYYEINKFNLSQSYIGPGTGNNPMAYRLMLNSAGHVGKPPYKFTYNQTALPARHGFQQDHWGYFNNYDNATLLPIDEINNFTTGANRTQRHEYAIAGMLLKIKYPTGGTLDFEYEPNQYSSPPTTQNVPGGAFLSSTTDMVKTTDFTINSDYTNVKIVWNNADDGTTTHNDKCLIEITGPNGYYRLCMGNSDPYGLPVILSPGTYTIRIETIGTSYYGDVAVHWLDPVIVPAQNMTVGGFRIKKVKNCAAGNPCIEREFQYTLDDGIESSGLIFQNPIYVSTAEKLFNGPPNGFCSYQSVVCPINTQSTSSVLPLANNSGAHVAYSHVTFFDHDATTSGKTVNKFLIDQSQNIISAGFPFAPAMTYDWLNGLPDEVTEYGYSGGTFKKVRRVKNHYSYDNILNRPEENPNQFYAYGAKIGIETYPFVLPAPCSPDQAILSNLGFGIAGYKFISSWHYLTSTEETIYNDDGEDNLTVTTYKRDNPDHTQVTEITKTTSSGEVLLSKMTYPHDLDQGSSAVIAEMQVRNMVSSVIENTTAIIRGGSTNVTSSDLIVYKNSNNAIVAEKHKNLKILTPIPLSNLTPFDGTTADSRYADEVKYHQFDSHNNVIEYSDKTGITKALVWGYNAELIVAEAANAAVQDIAFTSFESESDGGWTVSAGRVNGDGVTGDRCLNLQTRTISKGGLTSTGTYAISLWVKTGGTVNITGGAVSGPVNALSNGLWTNKIYTVTGATSVTIQGTGLVDELRLHPAQSIMTTYTHQPGIGVRCMTDPNSRISYYEYDNLNRLSVIRDYNNDILKRYTYNYKQ